MNELSKLKKIVKLSNTSMQKNSFLILFLSCFFCMSIFNCNIASAQTALDTSLSGLPALNVMNGNGETATTYSLSLQILALMTALTILPSLVLGMTSFTE